MCLLGFLSSQLTSAFARRWSYVASCGSWRSRLLALSNLVLHSVEGCCHLTEIRVASCWVGTGLPSLVNYLSLGLLFCARSDQWFLRAALPLQIGLRLLILFPAWRFVLLWHHKHVLRKLGRLRKLGVKHDASQRLIVCGRLSILAPIACLLLITHHLAR